MKKVFIFSLGIFMSENCVAQTYEQLLVTATHPKSNSYVEVWGAVQVTQVRPTQFKALQYFTGISTNWQHFSENNQFISGSCRRVGIDSGIMDARSYHSGKIVPTTPGATASSIGITSPGGGSINMQFSGGQNVPVYFGQMLYWSLPVKL